MNIGSYYVRRKLTDGAFEWFTENGWTGNQANAKAYKARRGADHSVAAYFKRAGFTHWNGMTQTATGDWFANH